MMAIWSLVALGLLFFVTSIIGVVTGSNSLVTVPVMFQFGIDEKVAVATNMFGLTFMAIGGTIPFVRQGSIEFKKLTPLVILTMIGSAIGALLVGAITSQSIKLIVTISMIVMVVFTLVAQNGRIGGESTQARSISPIAYLLTFLLAIYGGLYSGGYVTVLTAAFVAFASMSFGGAVAATKFVNVFSSGIATLIFMWQGLVDYRLGIFLAISMFAGAFVGAHYATKMNEAWLKRIFVATVFILAIKMLFDLF
jgi:uncharacterized membrane protein YfcA